VDEYHTVSSVGGKTVIGKQCEQ